MTDRMQRRQVEGKRGIKAKTAEQQMMHENIVLVKSSVSVH